MSLSNGQKLNLFKEALIFHEKGTMNFSITVKLEEAGYVSHHCGKISFILEQNTKLFFYLTKPKDKSSKYNVHLSTSA